MTRHLNDEELMAVLYQDASQESIQHLRGCALCQAALQELRAVDEFLVESLYRLHCPEPETLASYVEGDLSPSARRATHAHLLQCDACQREVRVLETLAPSTAVRSRPGRLALLAEGVRRLFVAALVPTPAPQPVRGDASSLRRYHTQDMDVLFSIMRAEGEKTATLIGQLVPLGDAIAPPFQGVAVLDDLAGGGSTVPIDEAGGFILTEVETGHWRARIELSPDVLIVMDIDV